MTTMTPTATADRGPECDHCRGSADGCAARQAARSGRCCRLCTHGRRPRPDGGEPAPTPTGRQAA